jgi:hypothetical protein
MTSAQNSASLLDWTLSDRLTPSPRRWASQGTLFPCQGKSRPQSSLARRGRGHPVDEDVEGLRKCTDGLGRFAMGSFPPGPGQDCVQTGTGCLTSPAIASRAVVRACSASLGAVPRLLTAQMSTFPAAARLPPGDAAARRDLAHSGRPAAWSSSRNFF